MRHCKRQDVCSVCREIREFGPIHANLTLARSWLDECLLNHPRCSGFANTARIPGPGNISLLDCGQMQFVQMDCETVYCALSYTWGEQYRDNRPTHFDTSCLPPVIADAIKATKCLGFRYLWVVDGAEC
jgi:hypothetical protein